MEERHAEVVVGVDVCGVHPQRLFVAGDRLLAPALAVENDTEVVGHLRVFGIEAPGELVERRRLVEPPLREPHVAEAESYPGVDPGKARPLDVLGGGGELAVLGEELPEIRVAGGALGVVSEGVAPEHP